MARLSDLLHGESVDGAEVARVRDVVVFEQPNLQTKLIRFGILLTLASAIATFGLLSDSVAAVIGAMIVAPLMLPIMGLAFGISLGDRRAITNSLLVGVAGAATAVMVGYVLALVMPPSFNPENVPQIMLRTSPRLLDLLAALATGLAGAFAIGRKDVSDTLPGVAIAISLVPPLANAGILFSTGRAALALGSVLLFATNYLAIVLTGALVFGLMGFPGVAFVGHSKRGRRIAIAIVVAMLLLILAPLGYSSLKVYEQQSIERAGSSAATAWIAGSDYRLVSATAEDKRLAIVVAGAGSLPDRSSLQDALKGKTFGLPVHVEVVASNGFDFKTQ
jgi:uncharacterized hydrophobic protein (TIGR00271 family)